MRYSVGDSAFLERTVTDKDIALFGEVSGDFNPAHFDEGYASRTRFGKRIAHGMLSASYISALLGMKLPGPGTIYLKQDLAFLGPVYIGDTIRAEVTIKEIIEEKNRIVLDTVCVNQENCTILKGTALVLVEELE